MVIIYKYPFQYQIKWKLFYILWIHFHSLVKNPPLLFLLYISSLRKVKHLLHWVKNMNDHMFQFKYEDFNCFRLAFYSGLQIQCISQAKQPIVLYNSYVSNNICNWILKIQVLRINSHYTFSYAQVIALQE